MGDLWVVAVPAATVFVALVAFVGLLFIQKKYHKKHKEVENLGKPTVAGTVMKEVDGQVVRRSTRERKPSILSDFASSPARSPKQSSLSKESKEASPKVVKLAASPAATTPITATKPNVRITRSAYKKLEAKEVTEEVKEVTSPRGRGKRVPRL